jgi:DNA primase
MGLIPASFIDELMARTDIVEVINARVPLKKAGREYKACCPFHGEKTPSFTVSPTKQFYHCFGCGAHGTALGFLMDYEHLELPGGRRGTGRAGGAGGAARGVRATDPPPRPVRVLEAAAQFTGSSSSRPPTPSATSRRAASSGATAALSASATRRRPGTRCSGGSARTRPARAGSWPPGW